MVQVEYEPLPVIASIEEAIENNKSFEGPSLKTGQNVDEIFNKYQYNSDDIRVINGSVKMGGQYHIYLEPYLFKILIYIQNQNHIYVDVKRLGGAFCSKSFRTAIVSTATAICSQKLNCQIKMRLPRDVDTRIMSGDHIFINKYKACFNVKTGKIIALKMDFFIDAGYWYDTTKGLSVISILHADNAYKIPNLEVNSYLCQTNKISAAHFRCFGFQNGNLSFESVFERISKVIQDEKKERKSIISICCWFQRSKLL